MPYSKVRLGRWASGEKVQVPLSFIPDRLRRFTDQLLPSTFTCSIVPGGRLAGVALRCPHRAWLLCSSISQWALPTSRERLNEARAVWWTKAAGQHPILWSISALFRPESQTFLFHRAFLSLGLDPFFPLNLPPTMESLTKLYALYGLPVTRGKRFQKEGSGAQCLPGPLWGDRYLVFQSLHWGTTPQLHPCLYAALFNKYEISFVRVNIREKELENVLTQLIPHQCSKRSKSAEIFPVDRHIICTYWKNSNFQPQSILSLDQLFNFYISTFPCCSRGKSCCIFFFYFIIKSLTFKTP